MIMVIIRSLGIIQDNAIKATEITPDSKVKVEMILNYTEVESSCLTDIPSFT